MAKNNHCSILFIIYMDNLYSLHNFSLIKRQAERDTVKRRKMLRSFLPHTLYPPSPSKIQLTKNKWACHHRSENSFGWEPVFGGFYGSIFTKKFDLREEKALKFTCYQRIHEADTHTQVTRSEIKTRQKEGTILVETGFFVHLPAKCSWIRRFSAWGRQTSRGKWCKIRDSNIHWRRRCKLNSPMLPF